MKRRADKNEADSVDKTSSTVVKKNHRGKMLVSCNGDLPGHEVIRDYGIGNRSSFLTTVSGSCISKVKFGDATDSMTTAGIVFEFTQSFRRSYGCSTEIWSKCLAFSAIHSHSYGVRLTFSHR